MISLLLQKPEMKPQRSFAKLKWVTFNQTMIEAMVYSPLALLLLPCTQSRTTPEKAAIEGYDAQAGKHSLELAGILCYPKLQATYSSTPPTPHWQVSL